MVTATNPNENSITPTNFTTYATTINPYPNGILNHQQHTSSPTPQQGQAVGTVTTAATTMNHIPVGNGPIMSPYHHHYQYMQQQHHQHQHQHSHHHHTAAQQQQQLPMQQQQQQQQVPVQQYYGQQMSPETARYQMTEYSNAPNNGGWPTINPSSQSTHPTLLQHHHSYAYTANQSVGHNPYGGLATSTTTTTANPYQPVTNLYDQQQQAIGGNGHHRNHTKIVYSATQQSAPPMLEPPAVTAATTKSKSVPNIIRELNAELSKNDCKRIRNNSQSERLIDGNANDNNNIIIQSGKWTHSQGIESELNPRFFSFL